MTRNHLRLLRSTVRRELRGMPEPLLAQLRARVGGDLIPKQPAPGSPFAKACEHVRDAHAELQRLPERLHDEEGHCEGVCAIRAHVKAASDYLDHYDTTSGTNPGLGLDVPPNPEAERSRAVAAALMAGYGATPTKRRRH